MTMEILLALIRAFFVGGLFCAVAQILIDRTRLTPARILTAYVVAGVVLGAVGVYGPVFDFAGAGASVPLTGFGFLISRGVREAVAAEGWIGALKGPLTAASGGIGAALTAGLLVSLLFDSRAKG